MADVDIHAWQVQVEAGSTVVFRPHVFAIANHDIGFAFDAFFHAGAGFASLLTHALGVGGL
jgi:hypothetical protein